MRSICDNLFDLQRSSELPQKRWHHTHNRKWLKQSQSHFHYAIPHRGHLHSRYGHPQYFKFKRRYQKYGLRFQTISPFFMAMIIQGFHLTFRLARNSNYLCRRSSLIFLVGEEHKNSKIANRKDTLCNGTGLFINLCTPINIKSTSFEKRLSSDSISFKIVIFQNASFFQQYQL